MERVAPFRHIELTPLTGALGADIRGINLKDCADEAFDEVRRALDRYHVVAVRAQDLDPASLHRVARRFGPFSGNPVHSPMAGYDDIVKFIREPDDTGKVIGEDWHMDLAWLAKPPGITMLYGEVIPPVGGDTCFASLTQLHDAISPALRETLARLVGVHSSKGVYDINAVHKHLALKADAPRQNDVEVEHPVICLHPGSGRRYVFVSSVLQRFKGMTEAETKPIVDYLVALATRPEFTCRVRWAPGTLTMWANPVVMHTAINDYSGYRRITYRTTVEGWAPVAAGTGGNAPSRAA